MATYQNRESFIPYSRRTLIELCLTDSDFTPENQQRFRDFCEILIAYYHFKFHSLSEKLKENFVTFNPEKEEKENQNDSVKQELIHQNKIQLLKYFRQLLETANYTEVSQSSLAHAFKKRTLLKLDTVVDFDDFEEMVCYYRGDIDKTIKEKKWFGLKSVPIKIDILQRVVLLIKFKNIEHFENDEINKLKFEPGKVYVYLYKNIPKYDLNFIFPNVKVKMTLKDRLILIASAVGAAVPMFIKILPRLLLIIAIILFFTTGDVPFQQVNITKEDVNNLMPILVTSLSLLVTFGGFAVKQYFTYKSKQIKFQKDVTDTLFFRQLAVNLGVFQSLIDEAEEEECKEIILVYYHLLTSKKPLTIAQIDDKIEEWMEKKFACKIDFDIKNTILSLSKIKGQITKNQDGLNNQNFPIKQKSLVNLTADGYCQALSLEQAKEVIDYTWDNIFHYANDA
jgi:hypothetical protein